MDAERFIRDSTVRVSVERYAVAKCTVAPADAFAVVRDAREITAVIDESRIDGIDTMESEPGWRILTFDVVLPFSCVGFLARVSAALAGAGVGIFVISSFSTDHVLVKDDAVDRACAALAALGCEVQR
jgi:hypothetical protein